MAALKVVFGGTYLPQSKVQVLPAKFGFLELKKWHDQLAMQVLEIPGLVLTDIDDATNRLLIGVESSEARDLVEQEAAALDIPRQAVEI